MGRVLSSECLFHPDVHSKHGVIHCILNRREHNSLLSEAFFIFMCAAGKGWHVCVSLDVLACVT